MLPGIVGHLGHETGYEAGFAAPPCFRLLLLGDQLLDQGSGFDMLVAT